VGRWGDCPMGKPRCHHKRVEISPSLPLFSLTSSTVYPPDCIPFASRDSGTQREPRSSCQPTPRCNITIVHLFLQLHRYTNDRLVHQPWPQFAATVVRYRYTSMSPVLTMLPFPTNPRRCSPLLPSAVSGLGQRPTSIRPR
jgi:hypothetical protein